MVSAYRQKKHVDIYHSEAVKIGCKVFYTAFCVRMHECKCTGKGR